MFNFGGSREGVENAVCMYFNTAFTPLGGGKERITWGRPHKPFTSKQTSRYSVHTYILFLHLRAVFVNNARKLVYSLRYYAASYCSGKA